MLGEHEQRATFPALPERTDACKIEPVPAFLAMLGFLSLTEVGPPFGPSIGTEEPRTGAWGSGMNTDRLDCSWCGSAASIEHGICQVCLMEYPVDTKVIRLPLGRELRIRERLDRAEQEAVAEKH